MAATKKMTIEVPAVPEGACGHLLLAAKDGPDVCGLKAEHSGDHRSTTQIARIKARETEANREKKMARLLKLAEELGYEVTKKA